MTKRKALLLPPTLTTTTALASICYIYKRHDTREISKDEVRKHRYYLSQIDAAAAASGSDDDDVKSSREHHHMNNLQHIGVTVIRSVLDDKEADRWSDVIRREINRNDGTCIVPVGGAIGRIHCRLDDRAVGLTSSSSSNNNNNKVANTTTITKKLYHELAQVADTPIKIEGDDNCNNNNNNNHIRINDIAREYFAAHGIIEGQYKLSQLQLLHAAPGSSNQLWHRDNVHPSLTTIIALTDIGSNGPTEMILRSHTTTTTRQSIMGSTDSSKKLPHILLASMGKGDAICYDSRVLHRGRGYGNNNEAKLHNRPVLVIRWDANQCPAPGTGFVGTQMAKWEGISLAFMKTIFDWVQN